MSFFFIFVVGCLLLFAFVLLLIRPSSDEKAVNKRLAAVKAPQGSLTQDENVQQYLKTLHRGTFGWLEDFLADKPVQKKLQLLILQADRQTTVGTVLMTCLGLGLGAAALAYLVKGLLLPAFVAGIGVAFLPIALLRFQRSRRVAKFNEVLPDCIDLFARSMRAGHSMLAALSIVATDAAEPAKTEFGEVCKKANYGLPLRDALTQLLDRVPSQDLRVLVTGMLVQKDTGGNLVEILDRILFVVRERMRLYGEIRTHTAQGRLTGYILCGLPIIMLGMINIINPGYSKVLFSDPFGRKLLYVGVALLFKGGFIIRKIINGIEV